MRLVQSLDRGLRILDFLSAQPASVSVTHIAQFLQVDKSTASRLLSTLQQLNFVEQDDQRRYRLGSRPIQLGLLQLNKLELRARAQPFMKELIIRTGETAHLAKLIQGRVIYIDRLESPNPVTVSTQVGGEAPAHCTATGKALISFLPSEELEGFLAPLKPPKFTPRTIVDLDALRHHLQEIKRRGYAIDDEELYVGVRCVAAPVFDYRGVVEASIGISGPAHRIPLERLDQLCPIVVEVASQLSKENGFQEVA